MNRDAPAHAVAAHRDAVFVHGRMLEQEPPTFGEHAGELRVRSFGLNLRAGDDMSFRGVTQLFENVDRESRVTEFGELPRLGLDVLAKSAFRMDQEKRRSRLLSIGIGQVSGNAVVFSRKGFFNDAHLQTSQLDYSKPEPNTGRQVW